ncbi:hypothetical protein IAU60_001250 [Kwoniella sp. DSM 27419]
MVTEADGGLSSSPEPQEVPKCPNGLFNFPSGSVIVEDADEEILELYMNLASTSPEITARGTSSTPAHNDQGGLGFLDSTQSILDLTLDLSSASASASTDLAAPGKSKGSGRSGKKGKSGTLSRMGAGAGVESVNVQIMQDLGALKGRKGDTGSVLWRSSLHLARLLLTQHYYPSSAAVTLLDPASLAQCNVLELGAGTGLLAVLLSRICGSYTASDRLENLKLVKKNLELNKIAVGDDQLGGMGKLPSSPKASTAKGKVKDVAGRGVNLEEIDWVAVSEEKKRHSALWSTPDTRHQYELVIAVDCIYNEHLVQPLVDTLGRYCPRGGRTVVWVVVELRSADVLTLFLERWMDDPTGPWTIVRLGQGGMGGWEGKKARWVGWVGWR